ncbi:MAG: DUF1697 domain-containing protein [Acidimicrobiales bacterium]
MSSPRLVAFLRGINVGGRRVTGDRLASAARASGLIDPVSYQASGNLLVTLPEGLAPPAAAARLSAALADELGYEVGVTLRSRAELAALVDGVPFEPGQISAATGAPQVILTFTPLDDEARSAVAELSCDTDRLVAADGAVHWLPADGVSGSSLTTAKLDRNFGPTTTRTVGTLTRLVAKLPET